MLCCPNMDSKTLKELCQCLIFGLQFRIKGNVTIQ